MTVRRIILIAFTAAIAGTIPCVTLAQNESPDRPVGTARGNVPAPEPPMLDRLLSEARLDEIYDIYWGVTYRTDRSLGCPVAAGDAAFVEWLRLNESGILTSDRAPPPLYVEFIRLIPERPLGDRLAWLALWRLRMLYDVARCPNSRAAPYVGFFEAEVRDVAIAMESGGPLAADAVARALTMDAATPYRGSGEWICLGEDTGRVPVAGLQRPSDEWPALYDRARSRMRAYEEALRQRR